MTWMSDISDPEQTVKARCLTSDPTLFFEPFETWTDDSSSIKPVVAAFRSNLRAAKTVGTLPYRLIRGSVAGRRYDRLQLAELIEGGGEPNSELYSEQQEHARSRVKDAWRAQEASTEFNQSVVNETLNILYYSLNFPYFSEASHELLRQVVVMIWSAFEVTSNDLGVAIINQRPALSKTVLQLDIYKQLRGIPITTLEEFDFDLSQSMGDILFSIKRLEAYASVSGSAISGGTASEYGVEQISNMASGGYRERFSPLVDRVPTAFFG